MSNPDRTTDSSIEVRDVIIRPSSPLFGGGYYIAYGSYAPALRHEVNHFATPDEAKDRIAEFNRENTTIRFNLVETVEGGDA